MVQVPGIRAMAEELSLTCIQAHRMDSTRAVLRTPTGSGSCNGTTPAGPGASGAAAMEASLASPDESRTNAASRLTEARLPGGAASPCHANGVVETADAAVAAEAVPAAERPQRVPAENERQRVRRERKLAAVRARGLQPPPTLLGAAPEPSTRYIPLGISSRSRAAHHQPGNKACLWSSCLTARSWASLQGLPGGEL